MGECSINPIPEGWTPEMVADLRTIPAGDERLIHREWRTMYQMFVQDNASLTRIWKTLKLPEKPVRRTIRMLRFNRLRRGDRYGAFCGLADHVLAALVRDGETAMSIAEYYGVSVNRVEERLVKVHGSGYQ